MTSLQRRWAKADCNGEDGKKLHSLVWPTVMEVIKDKLCRIEQGHWGAEKADAGDGEQPRLIRDVRAGDGA